MTETFTRDSDGAKFEKYEEHFGNITIRPSGPPLKTIDWSVVIELGLICEYSADGKTWEAAKSKLETVTDAFWSTHSQYRHTTCRILPDQVITYKDVSEGVPVSVNRLQKAGLEFYWEIVGRDSDMVCLSDIEPKAELTYELNHG